MKFDFNTPISPEREKYFNMVPFILFFLSISACLILFYDYIFFYQEKNTLFLLTREFLSEHLEKPGGLLTYSATFLTSLYYYPVAGGIILSLVITLISYLVFLISGRYSERKDALLPLGVGFALVYMQISDYRLSPENYLGLLFFSAIVLVTVLNPGVLKGWLPLIIAPLFYLFAGGFSFMFLLFMTLHYTFRREDKWFMKTLLLWLAMAITVLLCSEFIFYQNKADLLLTGKLSDGLHNRLFILVAIVITFYPFTKRMKKQLFLTGSRIENLLIGVLAFVIITVILILKPDIKSRNYFHAEKLFYERKFNELVEFHRANKPTNSLAIFMNNVALCETGRLNEELFSTMQNPDATLFLKWEMVNEILKKGGYFYYATGMINEAHRWAYENMVMKGLTPEDLNMLIKTELINGNYSMASKYIRLLGRTLFYSKEAARYNSLLSDNAVNSDPELGHKRKIRVMNDFFTLTDDPLMNLRSLLLSGSMNNESLQYLAAVLLLKKDYNSIASIIPEFAEAGFTKLPSNLEEAVVAISLVRKEQYEKIRDVKISEQTTSKWNRYLETFGRYRNDLRAAEPALRKEFGNTYWYYAFYK
ncbi:MAG TPA: DUF6057 family protein [Bacteroidales bacterium]|nr:DUF6057 family protein [Bacteroidales bacterium]